MFIRNLPQITTSSGGGGGGGPFIATANGTAGAPAFSFANDTTTGMYLIAAGQLGFSAGGTLRLTVETTDITSTVPFLGPNGSATAASFSFSSDPNTGMYRVGAEQLGFTTAGTLRLTIDNATSITATLPFYGAAGSNSAPTYSFSGDPNTGSYNVGADQWGVTTGGTLRLTVNGSTSITSTLPFYAPNGSASAPGYAFTNETDCGLYVIGTNNIGLTLNGVLSLSAAPTAYTLTQAAGSGAAPTAWTLTAGAHTTATASTEINDVYYNLTRTVTWAAGAIATQRFFRVGQPTLAFGSASTVTDAYTVAIDGQPLAGSNATLTNSWGLGVNFTSIGTATNTGVIFANNTDAAAGAQQNSPIFVMRGRGWRTNATAQSQTVDYIMQVRPVQGSASPTGTLHWLVSINGAAATQVLSVGSDAQLDIAGNILVASGKNLSFGAFTGPTLFLSGSIFTIAPGSSGNNTIEVRGQSAVSASTTPDVVIRSALNRTGADQICTIRANTTDLFQFRADGKIAFALNVTQATAAAGGATLPATPEGFLLAFINGTERAIPYYLKS